jgi:hypothetical protein
MGKVNAVAEECQLCDEYSTRLTRDCQPYQVKGGRQGTAGPTQDPSVFLSLTAQRDGNITSV